MAKKKPGTKAKSKKSSQVSKKPESSTSVVETTEQETEDALAASEASGIVDALERNRLVLIVASVALFALLCFFLVFKQLGKDRASKAAQAYTSAAMSKDISALDQVVANFPNSIAAGNALITKADIQIKDGKDATSTLNEVAGSHPRYAQAQFMLGDIYQKSGKDEQAIASFEKVLAVSPQGEHAPISRIRIGDVELARGNADLAKQRYDEVLSEHSESDFGQLVESRKAQIGVTMPKEVVAPEAPKDPAAETEAPVVTDKPE